MSRVLIDRKGIDDLIGIAEHIGIEKQRPKAARRFLDQIAAKFDLYASQPELGQSRPELGEGVRTFVFKKKYVVIYRPLADGIDVLRVLHGARDYPNLLRSE
jgi:toxin ParE1/3/4